METIIKVKGMVCGGCENRVKNALKDIENVETVEASHETGIVKIISNTEVPKKLLEETIEDIGFDVVKE